MAPFCLLFDLDGTLIDSDPVHFAAFNEVLAEHGRSIDLETYRMKIMGAANPTIAATLFPDKTEEEGLAIVDRKEALFRERVSELEPTHGIEALIEWSDRNGVLRAIVTNAPRANAEQMLEGSGLKRHFSTIVIGVELERGKPDPLPYETGLKLLGGSASHAMAFEDSLSGVKSASGAGLTTVGLRTSLDDDHLKGAGADLVVSDFRDPELLSRLEVQLSVARGAEGAMA